jgi:alkyldihydroxyacetonephosphate synthase
MKSRERSAWGWGWADRFPAAEERRALGELVTALLGTPGEAPREPCEAAALIVSPSRLAVPAPLAPFTSDGDDLRARRTHGRAYPDLIHGFRGDFDRAPDLVARPRDEGEIERALAFCEEAGVACIPYGGGTSVAGGVATDVGGRYAGVLSLDLGALDRVREVDPVSRAARIQAGATGPRLEAQLAPHNLSLRHYPQSFEFSTLGGWIATRAGGHYATLYTHIDDLVESVRMVTPRGLWQSRRLPASGAGPSPDRLALGSEGIFGVITEAWVRVVERPRHRARASVSFDEWEAAVDAVRALAQSGLHPTNCRLLDRTEALLHRVSAEGAHVLLLAFESADHPLQPWMARALEIAAAHKGRCPRGPQHSESVSRGDAAAADEKWRAAFFDGPYLQTALVSLGVLADTFETACTWDRFPALHAGVRAATEEALRTTGGAGVVSCRFSHVYPDGPAPYYTFLGRTRFGRELEDWSRVKQAASDAILALGGTITHHHAVGRTHRSHYERERPAPFAAALAAAKRALDPAWVMNPNVLLPVEA